MTAELKTGEASTGSVWNKNSWHWEEKDYNKASQQKLKEVLESVVLPSASGEEIKLKSVEPSGFASISVRKGKKVVVFEFAISMQYECGAAKGLIKIPEFSNDELDPVLRVDLAQGDESVKDFVRTSGAKHIKAALSKYVDFINSVETGDKLIESDKLRREAEVSAAKQAEIEKGLDKQRIAETVKAKEREAIANKTFVEASVWNPNSYHWETRKLNKWANEWVSAQLGRNPDFATITVSGEAENSIRKGKKISLFTLKISGSFKGIEFNIPSFTNEEGDDDLMPKIVCQESSAKKEIESAFKSLVAENFLSAIKEQ